MPELSSVSGTALYFNGREISLMHLASKLSQRILNLRFGFGEYARVLTVTSTNPNDLTDYAVPFTFDHLSLVNTGKMQRDLRDLRIVDPATGDVLPYWVERGIMTSSCRVWVKIPFIPANSQKTLLMIYGNPNLPPMSDPTQVFIRGASFDYGLDSGWSVSVPAGAPSPRFYMGFMENGGSIPNNVSISLSAIGLSPTSYPVMIVMRGIPAFSSVASTGVHILTLGIASFDPQGRSYRAQFFGDGTCAVERWSAPEGASNLTTASYIRGLPHEARIIINPIAKNIVITVVDEARNVVLINNYTISWTTWTSFSVSVWMANYSGATANVGHIVDYVYVRKYIPPEPTIAVGGEL